MKLNEVEMYNAHPWLLTVPRWHRCYHNLLMVIFRLFLSKRNDLWHFLIIFVPVNH